MGSARRPARRPAPGRRPPGTGSPDLAAECDSTATKARLLESATDEFAAHGIAGARVDRIAAAANANKQLIYAYFGSKDQLFDAVLTTRFPALTEDVPFTPDDLAGYVGRLFDHLVEHPEVLRLATWAGLERPTAVAAFEALAPTTRPTPGRRSG